MNLNGVSYPYLRNQLTPFRLMRKDTVMASNNEGYWSRSWALLTRDEGWIKPLLVLAAAQLVPIVGPFGVDGYALEWARLTSWGVDSSPKQKGVDVGACIKSGARAFVVALGYGIAIGLLRSLLTLILGDGLGSLLALAVTLAGSVLILMAKLRATIYQRISAGYQMDRLIDMIKRDTNGLLRILGLSALLGCAIGAVAMLLFGGVLLTRFADFIDLAMYIENQSYVDDWYVVSTVMGIFAATLPLMFVTGYLVSIGVTFSNLILNTAMGLWMRQFDVQNWGESSDPLPTTATQAAPRPANTSTPPQDPVAAPYAEPAPVTPQPAQKPSDASSADADAYAAQVEAEFADFIGSNPKAADSESNDGDFGFVVPEMFDDEPAATKPADSAPEEVKTFSLSSTTPATPPADEPVAEEVDENEVFSLFDDDDVTDVADVADGTVTQVIDLSGGTEDDEPFSEDEVLARAAAAIADADLAAKEERAAAPAPIEVENEADSDEVMTFSLGGPSNETDSERVEKIKHYVDNLDKPAAPEPEPEPEPQPAAPEPEPQPEPEPEPEPQPEPESAIEPEEESDEE